MLTYQYAYIERETPGVPVGLFDTEREAIDRAYETGSVEFAAVRRIGTQGPWIGVVIPLPAVELWRALWGELPDASVSAPAYPPLEVVR